MKHCIKDCEQYGEIREKVRSRLFVGIGSGDFSCKLFLEVKVEVNSRNVDKSNKLFEEFFISTNDSTLNKTYDNRT